MSWIASMMLHMWRITGLTHCWGAKSSRWKLLIKNIWAVFESILSFRRRSKIEMFIKKLGAGDMPKTPPRTTEPVEFSFYNRKPPPRRHSEPSSVPEKYIPVRSVWLNSLYSLVGFYNKNLNSFLNFPLTTLWCVNQSCDFCRYQTAHTQFQKRFRY